MRATVVATSYVLVATSYVLVTTSYVLVAALAVAGCGGSSGGGGPAPLVGAPRIDATSGSNQSGTVGASLPRPLTATVRDAAGNPARDVEVRFAITRGQGTLTPATTRSDAQGQASATLTLGTTAGAIEVAASADGASPAIFAATATAGPARQSVIVSGNGQTGYAGTTLPAPLVVAVRDASGNPVPGHAVTFAIASGGGSLSGTAAMTDASGEARTTLTLGSVVGGVTVTATPAGAPVAAFTATAILLIGGATTLQLVATAGDGQTGVAGGALAAPFVVTVRDLGGNPRAGTPVSFVVASGGGTLTATSANTDAQGEARTTLTLGAVAGTNQVVASAPGLIGSPVTFTATGTAGPAAQLVAVSGDLQTGTVARALAGPLVVAARDANGNAVAGVPVAFASGGGTVSPANATTDAQGLARTTATLGPIAGPGSFTASVAGLAGSPVTFAATGVSAAANQLGAPTGEGQTGTVGTVLALPIGVTVTDANGNPVLGVPVFFQVTQGVATLASTVTVTDGSGQARTTVSLGTAAGPVTLAASAAGLVGSPVTFGATAVAGPAATIAIASGSGQTGIAGAPLASPFAVVVRDVHGNAVSGAPVAFAVAGGGGTVSVTNATTDAQGLARTTLTTGTAAGANSVLATAALTGSPVSFSATGVPGPASQLVPISGDAQTGVAGTLLAAPLIVAVLDANGNPVPGHPVSFVATNGGGTLAASTATTDSNGRARTSLVLGTVAGPNAVAATAAGLAGSPVAFAATGTAGPALQLSIASGDGQSGTAGALLGSPLVVLVRDANGNPVQGTAVTFAVAGGGALGPAVVTTDASGLAATSFTLAPTAGPASVVASAGGLVGSPLTFAATGVPGPASQLQVHSGDGQNGVVGTTLASPFVAVARDANGNAVAGVTVAFSVTAGGGGVSATSALTDVTGVARTTLTLGTSAGANAVTATAAGLAGSPLTFSATGLAGPANRLVAPTGSGQIAVAGGPLAQPFAVTVTDAVGNVVSGASVFFQVIAGSATLGAPAASTDASGIARTSVTLGPAAGAVTITASAPGLANSPVTFLATATAGPAASLAIASGDAQTGVAGASLPVPFAALVRDANGNPVAGTAVVFAVGGGGGSLSATNVTTDAQGLARTTLTLGAAAGLNAVSASSGTLAGSPLAFAATGLAGPATQLGSPTGDGQSAVAGTALAQPLAVTVRDANGNAVAGVPVFFAVTQGSATLATPAASTDATGVAATGVVLGPAAGPVTIVASAAGLSGSPLAFGVTAVTGPAASIAKSSGDGQSGVAGAVLGAPFVAVVRDANGNPVAGTAVVFAVGGGGGSLSATNVTTDAQGLARTTLTLGAAAGLNAVSASSGTLAGSPLAFAATGLAGPPASIGTPSGDGQSAAVGTTLATALSVIVRDVHGNPVSGVPVAFDVTAGAATVGAPGAVTDGGGRAATTVTLGSVAGPVTIAASSAGLVGSPVTFNLAASPGAPTSLALLSGDAQLGTAGAALAQPLAAVVRTVANGEPALDVLGHADGDQVSFTRGSLHDLGTKRSGLDHCSDCAVDRVHHRLFVADQENDRVLVFDLSANDDFSGQDRLPDLVLGQVDLEAGSFLAASATSIQRPESVVYDPVNDRLFVSSPAHNRVLVFDVNPATLVSNRAASLVLGQPNFTSSSPGVGATGMNAPKGLAYSPSARRLFVCDSGNHRVLAFDLSGALSNGMGAADGLGHLDAGAMNFTRSQANDADAPVFYPDAFQSPMATAVDVSGRRLFVADASFNRVLVFELAPDLTLTDRIPDAVLGQPDLLGTQPFVSASRLSSPRALVFDPTRKRLFVADGPRVLVFDATTVTTGESAVAVIGQPDFTSTQLGTSANRFLAPRSLAYDDANDRLFVADSNRVLVFDTSALGVDPSAFAALGVASFTTSVFTSPVLALDPPTGRLVVVSSFFSSVTGSVFDVQTVTHGELAVATFGGQGNVIPQQSGGAAFDPATSRLFVTDSPRNRVLVYDLAAVTLGEGPVTLFGQPTYVALAPASPPTASSFSFPMGITVVNAGGASRVFLADQVNGRVLLIDVP